MTLSTSTRVLLFGDSISLGAAEIRVPDIVATVDESYVDHLTAAAPEYTFIVDAKIQRSMAHAIADLPAALEAVRPDIVLLILGGNDADMNWRRFIMTSGRAARSNVQPVEFGNNLAAMVDLVRQHGPLPIITDVAYHDLTTRGTYLSNLLNLDVTAMLLAHNIHERSDRELPLFWDQIERVAQTKQVPLVRFGRRLYDARPQRVMGVDGMHPNAFAHRLIAEEVLAVLQTATRAASQPASQPLA